MTCPHEEFAAHIAVNRLTDVDGGPLVGFSVDVTARCVACDEPLVFHGAGLPVGLVPDRPAISVDGTELRCPARMQSSDPHFGLGLAGFTARVREGDQSTSN